MLKGIDSEEVGLAEESDSNIEQTSSIRGGQRQGADGSAFCTRRSLFTGLGSIALVSALPNCSSNPHDAVKSGVEALGEIQDLTDIARFTAARRVVATPYGRIATISNGQGPAAVFLHGGGLNSFHWRHQLTHLASLRRCIGIDLMAFGHTEIPVGADVSYECQADMVLATLSAMGIDSFDLVGNDSGGAVAQIVAAKSMRRVRSLVLTNCEAHDNWPSTALATAHNLAVEGRLGDVFANFAAHPEQVRAPGGLAHLTYENAATATDELIKVYLGPPTATKERRDALNRYVGGQDPRQLVNIEHRLRRFNAPTLILWATEDVFFGLKWAYWLRDAIPGAKQVVEFKGAKIFFAEERHSDVTREIAAHWG